MLLRIHLWRVLSKVTWRRDRGRRAGWSGLRGGAIAWRHFPIVPCRRSWWRIASATRRRRSRCGKRPAVADLTFTALPGDIVALVGSTGAGKSTALALLHRAFDPQSGTVMIDGVNVRDMKLSALRRNIGVVFQEALLLNRSIADNLRIGKPDATLEEMRDAAARAQALEFIERSPEGFDTLCGRARPHAVRRRASAPVDRARSSQGPADPHSRRGRRARSMRRPKSRCRRHSMRSCRTGPPS